jgi:hypothetical protein
MWISRDVTVELHKYLTHTSKSKAGSNRLGWSG